MEPRLINNLTDAGQVDGIYIYEIPAPRIIKGVGTSVVGLVGMFERGPENEVVSIGGSAEFLRKFGGYGKAPSGEEATWRGYSGYRALAGKQWPSGLRVIRPTGTTAAQASITIDLDTTVGAGGKQLTVKAKWKGDYGNNAFVTIDTASDGSLTNGFKLNMYVGNDAESLDNLFNAMTAEEIAAANDKLNHFEISIADEADTEKAEWPATVQLATGSNGTQALDAWTGAIDKLLAKREVKIIFYAEPPGDPVTAAALNAYIKSKIAPSAGTTPFVMAVLSGPAGDDIDDAATAAALYRSSRLIYTWPWRKQVFSEAAALHAGGVLTVPSSDVVACAIASLDPVFDPACERGTRFINAATTGLEFDDLNRDDYVTANQQGICALEFDPDLGFKIVSGITTNLSAGEEMIHTRRLADYFIESIARSAKPWQNLPITQDWKDELRGAIEGFFDSQKLLRPTPRILDYEVDDVSYNDATTEAQGFHNILWRVRTPASARYLVFLSQVGPTVTVQRREDLEA